MSAGRYIVHRHRIRNAVGHAKFFSLSNDGVIRIYDEAGNVIETHEQAAASSGDFWFHR